VVPVSDVVSSSRAKLRCEEASHRTKKENEVMGNVLGPVPGVDVMAKRSQGWVKCVRTAFPTTEMVRGGESSCKENELLGNGEGKNRRCAGVRVALRLQAQAPPSWLLAWEAAWTRQPRTQQRGRQRLMAHAVE
jgi:hypothetical protein